MRCPGKQTAQHSVANQRRTMVSAFVRTLRLLTGNTFDLLMLSL